MAIEALKAVWHRGAVDADGKTGDGAGIHVQIPHAFFDDYVRKVGQELERPASSASARSSCRAPTSARRRPAAPSSSARSCTSATRSMAGARCRSTSRVIGEKANATRPEIEQIMIANSQGRERGDVRDATSIVIRRRIETRRAPKRASASFYICSLSCRSIIYKGMFLAEQLDRLLSRPAGRALRLQRSRSIHQRYSTNTFPTWRLAQPFRMLAHNGEINTLKGNVNWMKATRSAWYSPVYGERIAELKPVIQPGGSDSAALDNVFEIMPRDGGRCRWPSAC